MVRNFQLEGERLLHGIQEGLKDKELSSQEVRELRDAEEELRNLLEENFPADSAGASERLDEIEREYRKILKKVNLSSWISK